MVLLHIGLFSGQPSGLTNRLFISRFVTHQWCVTRGRSMYTSVSALENRSQAEAAQPKPSMIHSSRRSRSACVVRYSSCGILPPPALYWIVSSGYKGRPVIAAKRLASVDFPPPAFPNTATLFIDRGY